jgi:two-component system, sensor histidine kinase LadS
LILTMVGILPANFFTRWALQFGTTTTILLLSFGMADKINRMKSIILTGEKRYTHLVESTSDIIFTLDDNDIILSMNSAVRNHLGFSPEDLINTDFLDMIQETWSRKTNIARKIVEEYISDLRNKRRKNVQFRTTMKSKYIHEPKDLTVTMEYTGDMGTGYTILGKATPIIDDALSQFLRSERYTYDLNNYLGNAELISQRLTRNLYKYTSPDVIAQIRLALREAIVNSIEHGNLCLSFEEKTKSQINGDYFDIVKQRQTDPAFADKKVQIDYSMNEDRVVYRIKDEGEGFDYASMLEVDMSNPENLTLEHGRGLVMITSAFDEVKFNRRGNQILLVKYFKKK